MTARRRSTAFMSDSAVVQKGITGLVKKQNAAALGLIYAFSGADAK
jgi:hypothetical protein